ncbi:IS110 family transposase [Mycobacterium sp. 050128]|uniref:IS110 family transposase n=1 Tax=unclassified Mycobacterium TaxID=2642494 RepID=UPI002EDB2507
MDVVIGVDAHKATHTFVGVDSVGRKLAEITVAATTDGHLEALSWARDTFRGDLVWGVEDCRNLSTRLENDLLHAGQHVVRVPPQLMARTRASARTRGKSDPIDALAVARAVLREPDLPVASHDDTSRELKLLVDRREHLVQYRRATMNRLMWRVHELDPPHASKRMRLDHELPRQALRSWLATQPGLLAELAYDELTDIARLTDEIDALERRIAVRVRAAAPSLLTLFGCAELTAAKLIGETAGVHRFRSEAAYARHAGLAPIPHTSGGSQVRLRGSRCGNRQLNAALFRIAFTQLRGGSGADYYRRRRDAGDTHAKALRCLERKIVRKVYTHLRTDEANRHQSQPAPWHFEELERLNDQWSRALATLGDR